jgi:hypothetical protein
VAQNKKGRNSDFASSVLALCVAKKVYGGAYETDKLEEQIGADLARWTPAAETAARLLGQKSGKQKKGR